MQPLDFCRECGGKAGYFTRFGTIRDRHGERRGYAATCYCLYGGHKVTAYGDTPQEAEHKASDWWNRGIYDITNTGGFLN